MPKTNPKRLTNFDRSDRELLHIVHDNADPDGWASSQAVAEAMNMDRDRQERSSVGSRMGWMARYDFLERHPDEDHTFRLTEVGNDLKDGRLSKGLEQSLGRMNLGQAVLIVRSVIQNQYVNGAQPVADAVRREYLHNAAQRPNNNRRPRRRRRSQVG